MKNKRLKLRTITSILFSFLLTLLIFILMVNMGLCYGLFSNNCIISTLNEANLYNKVYEELQQNIYEIMDSYDMPLELFDDVIDQKRVYMACNTYVNKALQKETAQISTDRLLADLNDKLGLYYESMGQAVDTEEAQALIHDLEQLYISKVQIPVIGMVFELRKGFASVLKLAYPLPLLFTAVIIVCLLRLYRHKYRSVRYLNYAMLSASLLLISFCSAFIISKGYKWFDILPDYYGDFFVAFGRQTIQACLYAGIFTLLLSAVFIACTAYMKNQYYNNK
jgi:hypothetical protein